MSGKDLLAWQLDHIGSQIEKALAGLPDPLWDHKPSPRAMSAREIVEHLCECYTAYVTIAEGGKHAWGTFSVEDKSSANLTSEFHRYRGIAVAKSAEFDSPEKLHEATEYVLAHDAYHVGQLCSARLDAEPNWDPYAIY